MEIMHGWKTWVGGVLAIGCGMYLLVSGKNVEFGITLISMGFLGIGIGHKIEKKKE